MKNIKEIILHEEISIIKAMQIIDDSARQFVAIVNSQNQLVGTVTDGDVRRGILKGISLDEAVKEIMNTAPTFSYESSIDTYKRLLAVNKLKQLPILTETGEIIDIVFAEQFNKVTIKSNKVVLMVGGLGTRLRPLTEHTPKPMLKVGNKPILETIVEGFRNHGFVNFVLCVNYKKEIIQSYFQNGAAWGVNIEYIEETKRMGTAGALSLLKDEVTEPIFVMNGDLLTQVNFSQLLDFHLETKSLGTMCVREYEYQIPFGVIETDEHKLLSIQEKPMKKEFVNAGIYMLSPEALKMIPHHEFYDMPELFNAIIQKNKIASVFPVREYWMDIGRILDFEKANEDYDVLFREEESI